MKIKLVFYSLLLLGSLTACQKTAPKTELPPMEQLRGMWKMLNHEVKNSQGVWEDHPWMKGGTGYIIYDGLGHMAVHFTPKDYNKTKINWSNNVSKEEERPLYEAFSAKDSISTLANYVYTAKCRILEGDIIEHQKLSHGNPEYFTETVQRKFEINQDTLYLYPISEIGKRRVKWVRVN